MKPSGGVWSPQRRVFAQARAALSGDDLAGFDLAHSTPTWFAMRIAAEKRITVLQTAAREVEKSSSKISQRKARAISRRLKQLAAYPEHKPAAMILHEGES
jgi:hypothetical protein